MPHSETIAQPAATFPSGSSLVAAARALVPSLRQRSLQAAQNRRVPDATIDELRAAGLFRIAVPHRYGGYEAGWDVFADVVYELARGCASTAWVYSLMGQHPNLINRWGSEMMDEIYGRDPQALVSSSGARQGSFRKVPGGYQGSGVSVYSSGSLHSQWVLVGGMPVEGETYRIGLVLPKSDVEVLDTWHVFGLEATGSNNIRFDNVFVPDHRIRGPGGPKSRPIDGPMYNLTGPGVPFGLGAIIVGAAQGLLEVFTERLRDKITFGQKMRDNPAIQLRVGEASIELEAARRIIRHQCAETMAHLRTLKSTPPADPAAPVHGSLTTYPTHMESFVTQLAQRAAERLFAAVGAGGLTLADDMQRYLRDVISGTHQVGLDWDNHRLVAGRGVFAAAV